MTRREWRTLLVRGRAMANRKISDAAFSEFADEYRAWLTWLRIDAGRTDLLGMRASCHPFMPEGHPCRIWGPLTHRQTRLP